MHRCGVKLLFRLFVLAFALVAASPIGWANPPAEATFSVKKPDMIGAARAEKGRAGRSSEMLSAPAPRESETFIRPASTTLPRKGVRPGVMRLVRGTETLQLRVLDRQHQLVANTLPELARFLRAKDGSDHPIEARLITLLALVSDHFGGRDIIVTSGFRPYSPRQYTRHSNHNAGRAIDFAVRGVANETLRDFCRTFRNVGVGYYPNSAFVHLDVRETSGYWVDFAAPGQAPRYTRSESKDEADETAAEVEGMASVDKPGTVKAKPGDIAGSDTPTIGHTTTKGPRRESAGEHSVFEAR
jgi:uncharacterized protein YcbK (DUF882 family)